jgi:hypothetical protein
VVGRARAKSDIQRIETAFYAVPGYLYTEPGVAGPYHPTAGSCGATVFTLDGREFQIQDLLYHDRGHRGGLDPSHWNHERRYVEVFSDGTRALRCSLESLSKLPNQGIEQNRVPCI